MSVLFGRHLLLWLLLTVEGLVVVVVIVFWGFFLGEKCDATLSEPQDSSGKVMWG
jgi:hypothetical protein